MTSFQILFTIYITGVILSAVLIKIENRKITYELDCIHPLNALLSWVVALAIVVTMIVFSKKGAEIVDSLRAMCSRIEGAFGVKIAEFFNYKNK